MSGAAERALARLARPGAVLAPDRDVRFMAVYAGEDRRRRPLARLRLREAAELISSGALEKTSAGYRLTPAGRDRARRADGLADQAGAALRLPVVERAVDGGAGRVRAVDPFARLAKLQGADGAPFLSSAEVAAAHRLRDDWEAARAGLMPASDWSAPPRGQAPRDAGAGFEAKLARTADARQRLASAQAGLAPALWRVVCAIVFAEETLEALERQERWPRRSAKLLLKTALAQLAAHRS